MLGFHAGKWPDWRGKWENDWRRLEDSPSIQGIFSYLMFLQNKFREGKISETTGPLIRLCFTQYTWVCPKLGRLQNRHFNGKDDDLSWIMRSWWFYWYLATFGHVWYAWWPAWMITWVPLVWETSVSFHRCLLGDTSQLVVYNPYNPIYMYIWYMYMTVYRDNHIKPIHMYV